MSFSSEVKEELSKLTNLSDKEAVRFEFLGYLATNHVSIEKGSNSKKIKLRFSTENEYNINRFSKLLNNLNAIDHEIQITGKTFSINLLAPQMEEIQYDSRSAIILDDEKIQNAIENQETLQKAFVRGTFLGGGSVNNPKNNYHLELLFSNSENAQLVFSILENYNIHFKQLSQKQGISLYAKEGEEISKFLAFVGANQAVLKFEDIRVYRDIRNQVNRKVNCETANLNKIVNSSFQQIEDIQYLKQKGELKHLSSGIQEIAKLRVENPDASLAELGEMLPVPLGKSGVNHRLKAIEKKAEELRAKEAK